MIFFQGIPAGVIPYFPGNQNTESGTPVRAEMLRLNYNVPPNPTPQRLGVLAGDFAGFPNGRRVGDEAAIALPLGRRTLRVVDLVTVHDLAERASPEPGTRSSER